MNELIAKLLAHDAVAAGAGLAGTLLGGNAVLLGETAEGLVGVRQALRRVFETVEAGSWPLPVIVYDTQHSDVLPFTPGIAAPGTLLRFVREGAGWLALLDDTPQTVVTWHLVGVEADQAPDTAYPLGSELAALREAFPASGLWLEWPTEPMIVQRASHLPMAVTGEQGEHRPALTHVDGSVIDAASYRPIEKVVQTDDQLCFDLRDLFLGDGPVPHHWEATETLARQVQSLGDQIMAVRYGPSDAPEDPLPERPVADGLLLGIREPEGAPLDALVADDGTRVTPSSAVDYTTGQLSSDGAQYLRHKRWFTWPETPAEGVKLTLAVRDGGGGSGTGYVVKLCRGGQDDLVREAPSIIELAHTDSWGTRLASYTGSTSAFDMLHSSVQLRPDIGRTVPAQRGQVYEVYVFPDMKAMVYVNGLFATQLTVPGNTVWPGAACTLSANVLDRSVILHEAKVERFPVPADYVPESPLIPQITMMDWSKATSVNEANLAVDDTSTGFSLDRYNPTARFVITTPCVFSLRGVLKNSPSSQSTYLRLRRVDGEGYYNHIIDAINGWCTFPSPVEAGLYELYVRNYSYSVRRKRCKWRAGNGVCQTWEYYWQSYPTYHSMDVHHWRVAPVAP